MICQKNHRNLPEWAQLSDSQAGEGRHICVGCAYSQGQKDASNEVPENIDNIKHLPHSQAQAGRHKDAEQAYRLGYASCKKYNE